MSVIRSAISNCRRGYTCLVIQAVQRSRIQQFATNVPSGEKPSTDKKEDLLEREIDKEESAFLKSKFPTKEHLDMLVEGVPFRDIPIVHIKSSFNNTIITVEEGGKKVTQSSGGKVGFKNTNKSSNIAAQAVATDIAQKILFRGMKTVRVCVNGFGAGRLPAIKALEGNGLKVLSITDTTKLPHNGNRPRKAKRT